MTKHLMPLKMPRVCVIIICSQCSNKFKHFTLRPKVSLKMKKLCDECTQKNIMEDAKLRNFNKKSIKERRKITAATTINQEKISRWNPDLTLASNCIQLNISIRNGYTLARRYKLKFKADFKPGQDAKHKDILYVSPDMPSNQRLDWEAEEGFMPRLMEAGTFFR